MLSYGDNMHVILLILVVCSLTLTSCKPVNNNSSAATLAVSTGEPVKSGRQLVFPDDHGIHPEQGIEWWYLTANLTSDSGETFGVQWTLFRTLIPSDVESLWWDNNLYFAHFALQHQQHHVAFERFARVRQATVTPAPFSARIDEWRLRSIGSAFLPLKLDASQHNYSVSLTLKDSPITLHGDNGYSQKTLSGHASYYFSFPFLNVTGQLVFAGKEYAVSGNAWYDREWSASLLDRNQLGWDWFSMVDESSGNGLMLFCIRNKAGAYDNCSGTLIDSDGSGITLKHNEITLSVLDTITLDNKAYPQKWRVMIPDHQPIIIESITRDSRNQLTIPYWEGRIQANGGFVGKGYGEVTGY